MPPDTDDDLTILHPDREVTLTTGECLSVREYAHMQWLRLLPQAEPLVAAFAQRISAGQDPDYDLALSTIGAHPGELLPVVCESLGRTPQWLHAQNADDLEIILLAWWAANAHFFARRAVIRLTLAQSAAAGAAVGPIPPAGAKSSPA